MKNKAYIYSEGYKHSDKKILMVIIECDHWPETRVKILLIGYWDFKPACIESFEWKNLKDIFKQL